MLKAAHTPNKHILFIDLFTLLADDLATVSDLTTHVLTHEHASVRSGFRRGFEQEKENIAFISLPEISIINLRFNDSISERFYREVPVSTSLIHTRLNKQLFVVCCCTGKHHTDT